MKTKQDVLNALELMMGSYTPACVCDANGSNAAYCSYNVDWFFDEDSDEYLRADDWTFEGLILADSVNVDIDEWAQELDSRDKESFEQMMEDGNLYIASFSHEDKGHIEIMVWE